MLWGYMKPSIPLHKQSSIKFHYSMLQNCSFKKQESWFQQQFCHPLSLHNFIVQVALRFGVGRGEPPSLKTEYKNPLMQCCHGFLGGAQGHWEFIELLLLWNNPKYQMSRRKLIPSLTWLQPICATNKQRRKSVEHRGWAGKGKLTVFQ